MKWIHDRHITDNTINWLYIPEEWLYGGIRRNRIVKMFDSIPNAVYAVNCKHRQQLKNDPDLRKLIKKGFLKTVRWSRGRRGRQTYLVKAEFKL